jgi:hypothetical protein
MVPLLTIIALIVVSLAIFVIRREMRIRAYVARQIEEDVDAGVFDTPSSVAKPSMLMTIPRKHPALRTRNSRSLP